MMCGEVLGLWVRSTCALVGVLVMENGWILTSKHGVICILPLANNAGITPLLVFMPLAAMLLLGDTS